MPLDIIIGDIIHTSHVMANVLEIEELSSQNKSTYQMATTPPDLHDKSSRRSCCSATLAHEAIHLQAAGKKKDLRKMMGFAGCVKIQNSNLESESRDQLQDSILRIKNLHLLYSSWICLSRSLSPRQTELNWGEEHTSLHKRRTNEMWR